MSANPSPVSSGLQQLPVSEIVPNERNPRLDFPQDELERLAESIDKEGILVPIVVFPKDGKYSLVDGERRFRCARELGLETVPALITTERPENEILLQMFNIHLIREPWRDIPTARALARLAEFTRETAGDDPTDAELRDLTGLSIERVRQLRYVVDLPNEWQSYIREGTIPLNFFWELKKNVIDPLAKLRPQLLEDLGTDEIMNAFVDKRLNEVITDTVSLRKMLPIIRFAAQDAETKGTGVSQLDQSIIEFLRNNDMTINDIYEETVSVMVAADKLERQTNSMVAAFKRLLNEASTEEERIQIQAIGERLIDQLSAVLRGSTSKT